MAKIANQDNKSNQYDVLLSKVNASNENVKALLPLFKARTAEAYYHALNNHLHFIPSLSNAKGKTRIEQAIQNICKLKDGMFQLHTSLHDSAFSASDLLDDMAAIEPPFEQAQRLKELSEILAKRVKDKDKINVVCKSLMALSNAFLRLHLSMNDDDTQININ